MTGALLRRTAAAAALWWALAEGALPSGAGAAVAALAIVGAAAASVALLPPTGGRLRLRTLPGFAAFFLARSIVGGLDVARRALLPGGAVRPGVIELDPGLPAGAVRALYIQVVSVLPGTLVAEEVTPGGPLRIHVIDTSLPVAHDLAEVALRLRGLVSSGDGRAAGAEPP